MAEKRLHTAYVLRRRYRRAGRVLAAIGGLFAAVIVGTTLAGAYAGGEPVPLAAWAIGIAIVALAALVPWALVRWRWRSRRFWLARDGS